MDIKAFLQPPVVNTTKEVFISKRFKGADGKPVPFKIRAIAQETNDKLTKACTVKKKMDGQLIPELDNVRYSKKLIAECVIEPDFKDAEMCSYYGVVDPLDVPGRMLSVGEYGKLVKAIMELNEIAMTEDDIEDIKDEIKN